MSQPQKILTIILWMLAVSAMISFATLFMLRHDQTAQASVGLPVLYSAPDFALTDQQNHAITAASLRGSPWMADFVYTTCGSICPKMSGLMSQFQKSLPPNFKLVSFTVDPKHDTPPVLAEYASAFGADNSRWLFLTGPEAQQIEVIRGMKLTFIPAIGADPLQHDAHFVLVDAAGKVRGYYDSLDPAQMAKLNQDAAQLGANP